MLMIIYAYAQLVKRLFTQFYICAIILVEVYKMSQKPYNLSLDKEVIKAIKKQAIDEGTIPSKLIERLIIEYLKQKGTE